MLNAIGLFHVILSNSPVVGSIVSYFFYSKKDKSEALDWQRQSYRVIILSTYANGKNTEGKKKHMTNGSALSKLK